MRPGGAIGPADTQKPGPSPGFCGDRAVAARSRISTIARDQSLKVVIAQRAVMAADAQTTIP
ncbi:hypothetical protein [Lysobacter gummosus]|uniref:hypothetical protein n=1 Tax=Lysobacter gummosus TaxID=262324 RepID=UPI003628891E